MWRAFVLWVVLGVAGCATNIKVAPPSTGVQAHWQGRLAVKVTDPQPRAFAANFDLQGNAAQGQLVLSTPLGTTLATLEWNPEGAMLVTNGPHQHYPSIKALAVGALGVDIPVTEFFDWFDGIPAAAPDWDADLSQFSGGRISARREGTDLQAELKLIFERQTTP